MVRAHTRTILLATATGCAWTLAAAAQQAPTQPLPGEAPATQETEPVPQAEPTPSKTPAVKPSETPAAQSLVGLNVFSSDGTRVGEVRAVNTGPSGDVVGLHVRTGGFLGFGGRVVSVPEGRFTRSGQTVRLDLDADQVNGLPEVKD